MSQLKIEPKVYDDGRTMQSFKDETDVNAIINKHVRMNTLSHLEQWGGQYGDLSGFDFQEAHNQQAKAASMFEALPSQIRKKFHQDPAEFFAYVNDPANKDTLAEKLPELAKERKVAPNIRPTADNPPGQPETPAPAAPGPSGDENG